MPRIIRIPLIPALVAAAGFLASCAGSSVAPDEGVRSGACTSDLSCPYGQECGALSCAPSAPGLYPHIQTASAIFRDYQDAAEMTWRAAHCDLLINQVLGHVDEIRGINPNARLFGYMYSRYHNYNDFGDRADAWAVQHGYDPEDFYLHYREDVAVPTWEGVVLVEGFPAGTIPGWNPSAEPGDPPATATSRAESRVPGYNDGTSTGTSAWKMANINHDGYRRFLLDWATQVLDGTLDGHPVAGDPIDGIVFDNAIYYPIFGEGQLEKSDEYYGVPMTDQHPHALGFASLYPEIAGGLANRFGRAADIMPNFGHVLFTERAEPAPQAVVRDVPWIWAEVWVAHNSGSTPTTGPQRRITYDTDYRKALLPIVRQTRGAGRRVLGARDYSFGEAGSDRGRLFTLALYYLVHNRNTYYLYETVPHHSSSLPMSQWAWNPAVEFDIGQPDQVPPGMTDFEGRYPSNEHYVFATGGDPVDSTLTYHVLARRFTNALVLAKMLPAGSSVGDDSITEHDLDGSYAILQADGTLGAIVTRVSIRNNEGIILIPVD